MKYELLNRNDTLGKLVKAEATRTDLSRFWQEVGPEVECARTHDSLTTSRRKLERVLISLSEQIKI